MRPFLPPLLLAAALLGPTVHAQPAQDPVADSIVRNLTRGIRVPGQSGDAVTAPRTPTDGPVQARTTAPPDQPAVSLMVVFATGSAALTPQAEALVASLARALASPDLARSRFRIEGHTDTVGDAAMNQALSERRAATVRDMLVARYGLDAGRLEAIGLGETRLLVVTPDGRAESRNRRVQVINLGE
ncbi:OmpA family protein [Roseomonas sp. CAU 1739]|uniref:OmpA family protein n=1 Tax=Roseomonas sp. CAU 1739 TaxID=3140364 RepID=UPI00325BDF34